MSTAREFRRTLPDKGERLRHEVFGGALFHAAANVASLALVEDVEDLLSRHLGPGDPRTAQLRLRDDAFFGAIGRIRRVLFEDSHFHRRVFDVIEAAGLDPGAVAFDPVRLRVVSSGGHRNPRAAPLYYAHRDTWFSISPAAIAWWIAVHDTPATEGFEIYPDWFGRAVPNDSSGFDFDRFQSDERALRIGWQSIDAGRNVHYSQTTAPFEPGHRASFEARRGDNVLFSVAHLHRTLPHDAERTRFSLDFRVVHERDLASSRAAPSVDAACSGDATSHYIRRPGA